mmetsp:Transcript_3556/g.8363  ORF Transcript_3556/g.8363 Transcript_3556/m.8363 type:complete len:280 (-) Transcript_3556:86-925(-)
MSLATRAQGLLQRATELAVHEPIVAYYCRVQAVELLVKQRQAGAASAELDAILGEELGKAEDAKKTLDLSHGREVMEGFALSVFDGVDVADRSSGADGTSATKFYAASQFLEVCAQFYEGELPPDLAEKAKYAKFRAVQIREALRQGLRPPPPPGLATEAGSSAPDAPGSEPSNIGIGSLEGGVSTPAGAPAGSASAVGSAVASSTAAGDHPQNAMIRGGVAAGSSSAVGSAVGSVAYSQAKKKTEFASSALDFNDVAGARQFLTEALQLLEASASTSA